MTVKFFRTFSVTTPQGTFTRGSATPYAFIVVRESPRARKVYELVKAGDAEAISSAKSGVQARWVKDCGFVVSWHTTEKAAAAAAASAYGYDANTTVLGLYPVPALTTEAQAAA